MTWVRSNSTWTSTIVSSGSTPVSSTELPEDLPDAAPTAEQNAALQRITAEFSASVDDALAARDDGEVSERIYNRLAQRPGALRALDRVGRAVTSY